MEKRKNEYQNRGNRSAGQASGKQKARYYEKKQEQNASASAFGRDETRIGNGAVIGRNAVRELLKSGRAIDKLLVQSGEREGALVPLVGEAIARGIPVVETEKRKMDQIADHVPHQGIIAMAAEKEYCEIEDILAIAAERGEKPLIVVADGIADPYNLGAVIRCAEGCGAHGLILPKRHAAGLSPVVTKASAGAIEHLAIAKVPNIATAIETLKKNGLWIYTADADGTDFRQTDMSGAVAIVMGSEGAGVSELVRKKSDFVVSIPMYGKVNSFNVSTASAVLLCEAAYQQRKGQ
jgi:23S rRNA (guanosine2251-2'-O)-methyltransferase